MSYKVKCYSIHLGCHYPENYFESSFKWLAILAWWTHTRKLHFATITRMKDEDERVPVE